MSTTRPDEPNVAGLFESHDHPEAVIGCALEGRLGKIVTDGRSSPRVARLDLGCYSIFGGDPGVGAAAELIRGATAPRELIFPNVQAWRALAYSIHGASLVDQPMRAFDPRGLKKRTLEELAREIPPGFSIGQMDLSAARQLDPGLEPHALQVHRSPEEFIESGIGFSAIHEGKVVCAATSYAISSDKVEVAISTRARFRSRGLARAVAAAMLLHCMKEGRMPHWSAVNPVSKRLALKLGYVPAGLVDVFDLPSGGKASR